jgi:hypothetical protein
MSTLTYTWSINQVECYPEAGGDNQVICIAHWTLDGTDGTYSGSVYGAVGIPLDPKAPFTPYADLTEDQIIGWVKQQLAAGKQGKEAIPGLETAVAYQISQQISPDTVAPPLPWAASLTTKPEE